MKNILISLLIGFLILVAASAKSSAGTDGIDDFRDRGCHEEGMPMMPPFLPQMIHQSGEMIGGPETMSFVWWHLAGLDLDEKQKEAIKEIKNRVTKDTIRKGADLEVARIDLRDIQDKDQVNMNAAEATLKKIASLQTDISLSHIKAIEEIKMKLTPEQRKKIKEILKTDSMTKRMMHGGMRMTPPIEKKEGALQEKEP